MAAGRLPMTRIMTSIYWWMETPRAQLNLFVDLQSAKENLLVSFSQIVWYTTAVVIESITLFVVFPFLTQKHYF